MTTLVPYNRAFIIQRMLNAALIIHPDIGPIIANYYILIVQAQYTRQSIKKILSIIHSGLWLHARITEKSIKKLLGFECAHIIKRALSVPHSDTCFCNHEIRVGILYHNDWNEDSIWLLIEPCICDDSKDNDIWGYQDANSDFIYSMKSIIEFLTVLHNGGAKYYKNCKYSTIHMSSV